MNSIFDDEGHLINTAELHFAESSPHDHRREVKMMKFNLYLLKLGSALLLFAVDTACSWASVDERISDRSQGGAGASGDAGNSSTVAAGLAVNLKTAKNSVIIAERGISPIPTVIGNLGVRSTAGGYIAGFSLSEDTTKGFTTSTQVTSNAHAAEYAVPTPSNWISVVGDMQHSSNYSDNVWPNNFQPDHDRPEAQFVANCSNSMWPSTFQPDHDCQ